MFFAFIITLSVVTTANTDTICVLLLDLAKVTHPNSTNHY